ncbi:hypothetical protein F4776DRAFT_620921 [Hypoxylon sp. NC0597]|nr:hypothetical protein F4776DRAFT_620921 [Hypoxylon sp. NC0597]
MKHTLTALLLPLILTAATSVSAAAISTPTPEPGGWQVNCAGGLDTPCQDLCFCSGYGDTVNCHADPTSRCAQMCHC